jgi:hypothetical protein
LSDVEEDLKYIAIDITDGDDDECQVSNVTFNSVVKKSLTYKDSDSSKEVDDDFDEYDHEDVEHKKIISEYERLYSKWLEVA